ncbi:hypothetical protein GGX14DRAFT_559039 [Mycena pura]|uniref:HNH nuclease domain-containing protein n=1 Tax=Mycena pura TaxID=153505 RepID=A0AAD6VSP0_9AGAR|nr:hypothetical protein GGX14DRAFT_559039 [Mycena pura]
MAFFLDGGDPKPKKGGSIPLAVQAVQVYHPGCNPPKLVMILAAFAAPSGQCGVPFFVVLWACRILANNKDGTLCLLSTDAELTAPADDDKKLLPPGKYAYRVTGEGRYAICTTFRAWSPPEEPPPRWCLGEMGAGVEPPASTESIYSEVVKAADRQCVVTGVRSRRKTCRLVPEGEKPWWLYHNMNGKTNNQNGINSTSNGLSMRADLNGEGMDKGYFIFAPYGGKAACVCIDAKVADFAAEYHLPLGSTLREFETDDSAVTVPEPNFSRYKSAKRKRAKDDDAGREDQDGDAGREGQEDDDAGGGRDKEQHKTQVMDDAGPLLSSNDESSSEAASEPSLDLCEWTERALAVAERMDAALAGRPLGAFWPAHSAPLAAPYEVEAGMYHGYSKALRLQLEYRKQHPEVSAVRRARVAHVGEDDDEQSL